MNSIFRKSILAAHITVSVAWIGAVASFLTLAVVALTSGDIQVIRAVCLAMSVIAWTVILPLALASLLTGIIQSLSTAWGLIRHYWIVVKLVLTLFATVILLLKMRLIDSVANATAGGAFSVSDLRQEKMELLIHSLGGLLVLLFITGISVFKPWGKTRYGRRKLQEGA